MAIRGVRLLVPAAALEDAREVLSEDAYFEYDPDDEEADDAEDGEDEPDEDSRWQRWGEWGPGAR
jgi:hypothetical protein